MRLYFLWVSLYFLLVRLHSLWVRLYFRINPTYIHDPTEMREALFCINPTYIHNSKEVVVDLLMLPFKFVLDVAL